MFAIHSDDQIVSEAHDGIVISGFTQMGGHEQHDTILGAVVEPNFNGEELRKVLAALSDKISQASKNDQNTASTLTASLLEHNGMLTTAWVGDSPAIVLARHPNTGEIKQVENKQKFHADAETGKLTRAMAAGRKTEIEAETINLSDALSEISKEWGIPVDKIPFCVMSASDGMLDGMQNGMLSWQKKWENDRGIGSANPIYADFLKNTFDQNAGKPLETAPLLGQTALQASHNIDTGKLFDSTDNISVVATEFVTLSDIEPTKKGALLIVCDGVSTPLDGREKPRRGEISKTLLTQLESSIMPWACSPNEIKKSATADNEETISDLVKSVYAKTMEYFDNNPKSVPIPSANTEPEATEAAPEPKNLSPTAPAADAAVQAAPEPKTVSSEKPSEKGADAAALSGTQVLSGDPNESETPFTPVDTPDDEKRAQDTWLRNVAANHCGLRQREGSKPIPASVVKRAILAAQDLGAAKDMIDDARSEAREKIKAENTIDTYKKENTKEKIQQGELAIINKNIDLIKNNYEAVVEHLHAQEGQGMSLEDFKKLKTKEVLLKEQEEEAKAIAGMTDELYEKEISARYAERMKDDKFIENELKKRFPENPTQKDGQEVPLFYTLLDGDKRGEIALLIDSALINPEVFGENIQFQDAPELDKQYRGWVFKVAHGLVHGNDIYPNIQQISTRPGGDATNLEEHLAEVDYLKGELTCKFVDGSRGTIDKDRIWGNTASDAFVATAVASAKQKGWSSYRIQSDNPEDLLKTALAFEINRLPLTADTQAACIEAVNKLLPEDQKLKEGASYVQALKHFAVHQEKAQQAAAATQSPTAPNGNPGAGVGSGKPHKLGFDAKPPEPTG